VTGPRELAQANQSCWPSSPSEDADISDSDDDPDRKARELRVEHSAASGWPVYRLRIPAHGRAILPLSGGRVLVVVSGTATLFDRQHAVIESSQADWPRPGSLTVHAPKSHALDAVVVPA
jgi:hypothetical protein